MSNVRDESMTNHHDDLIGPTQMCLALLPSTLEALWTDLWLTPHQTLFYIGSTIR